MVEHQGPSRVSCEPQLPRQPSQLRSLASRLALGLTLAVVSGVLVCGCGPKQPALLGPVIGVGPAEAIAPIQRPYAASVLYSQTWRDGMSSSDLFQAFGGDRPRTLETGQYVVPSRITAGMNGDVFVSDDWAGRTCRIAAAGTLSRSFPGWGVLGTDRAGNLYLCAQEQGLLLASLAAGGTENYREQLDVGDLVYDLMVSPAGMTQLLYSSPDGTGDYLLEVSPTGEVGRPIASDGFGIRYEAQQGEWYKLQCPEVGRLQLCSVSGSGLRPVVEISVDQRVWDSYHPLGMDDMGRFYLFLHVPEVSDQGSSGLHYYVQVVDPGVPETWAVDLGVDPGLTSPTSDKVAVDRQGTVYFLRTDMDGMKVLAFHLEPPGQ